MESRGDSLNTRHEEHSPTQIVCIYTMRDELFYRELQTYLVLWQNRGAIYWLELGAGDDVERTLLAFVQQADLTIFLCLNSQSRRRTRSSTLSTTPRKKGTS
jgi:hypothetical protein